MVVDVQGAGRFFCFESFCFERRRLVRFDIVRKWPHILIQRILEVFHGKEQPGLDLITKSGTGRNFLS